MRSITVESYAKVNLGFELGRKREDGYHEIRSVMQITDLADDVTVSWTPSGGGGGISIAIDPGRADLPADETNDAARSARVMADRYGAGRSGEISIAIVKRVPAAAGLAGGSGDGAAAILALDVLWDLGLTLRELCGVASGIGADMAFQVLAQAAANRHLGIEGGSTCALCEGIGEILTPVRGADAYVVLSKPPVAVSTREVYDGMDRIAETERTGWDTSGHGIDALTESLNTRDVPGIVGNMSNSLEMYTLGAYNQVVYTKCKMEESGLAAKVLMSGSGPTVYALVRNRTDAEKLYRIMKQVNDETFIAHTL
ncbi:MAG: 4-(cytidine 5'-diphospho)-2-C-methyl-D-erythritol kinase [Anaerovoracaceae bacterium]